MAWVCILPKSQIQNTTFLHLSRQTGKDKLLVFWPLSSQESPLPSCSLVFSASDDGFGGTSTPSRLYRASASACSSSSYGPNVDLWKLSGTQVYRTNAGIRRLNWHLLILVKVRLASSGNYPYTNGHLAVFTLSDLTFVLFPVLFLWQLNMKTERKIGLIAVFTLGLL